MNFLESLGNFSLYLSLLGKTKIQTGPVSNSDMYAHNNRSPDADLLQMIQKQNEMLIKEHRPSTLSPKEIPVFKDYLLKYVTFIHTFEHSIEDRTTNDHDRLFFLDQYTQGARGGSKSHTCKSQVLTFKSQASPKLL